MRIGDLMHQEYPTVSAYAAVSSIDNLLARERYAVIKDEEKFLGILTPADTLINPHRLVIDCMTAKPVIDFDADLNEALLLMQSDSLHVLPVVKENGFVGVVRERDILDCFLERNRRLQQYIDSIEEKGVSFKPSPQIAHDFNNLLSASFNLLDLTARHLEDTHRARRFLRSAYEGFAELAEMVRLVFEGSDEQRSLTKVTDVVQDLRSIISLFADPLKYKVDFSFCAVPYPVGMDRIQLSRLIGNIITNATYAMRGGGTLSINVENVNVNNDGAQAEVSKPYLKISITDTGMGMDDSLLGRVFEPTFTTKPDGSGLGLSIAKTLVEKCGGYIETNARPDQGTTFAIYLPSESR